MLYLDTVSEALAVQNTRKEFLPNRYGEFQFGGISGVSIWQAYTGDKPPRRWSVESAKIVALQFGYFGNDDAARPDRIKIVGTSWWAIIHKIYQLYPDLRNPMRLHGLE